MPALNTPLTVQARILDKLVERVDSLRAERNGTDDLFNMVWNGEINDVRDMQLPIAAVEQGNEETNDMTYPFIEKELTVFIEFRFERDVDIDPYVTYRYFLGRLQQRLFGNHENISLDGLAIDVQEIGNNPQIAGSDDPSPGGVITARVRYQYVNGNPYVARSEYNP